MHDLFIALLPETAFLAYLAVFIGMVVEGEVTLFTALYLGTIGFFNFQYLGMVLVLGIFAGDFLWYRLGIFVARHPWLSLLHDKIESNARILDEQLEARPIHTLFISKFTYGLNRIALMRAGATRIPLTTFLEADIMAVVVWLSLVGGIGFLLSKSFVEVTKYIKYVEVGFFAGIIIFIFATRFISRLSYANVRKTERIVHAKNVAAGKKRS